MAAGISGMIIVETNKKGAGMCKKCLSGVFVLALMLMLTISCGAAGNKSVIVGQNGVYDLNGAVSALGKNAGDAVIYLTDSLTMNSQLELPSDLSGLKSVTFASYSGSQVTVSMGGNVICANGVPFILERGVTLSGGFLVGGKCTAQPGNVSVDSSELLINGAAEYVIGGGLAMGYGAVSSVKNVNVIVNGSANYVHGGGYAYNGGRADVSELANLVLSRTGIVTSALYGGGYASGSDTYAPVRSTYVIALGTAGSVKANEGLAESSGVAAVGAYDIELVNPKTPVFPVDPGYRPGYGPGYNPGYDPGYDPGYVPQITGSTVMYIGPGQQSGNFTDAVNQIPRNAGNVEFRLMGNFVQNEDVVIPSNRGIVSLSVTANRNPVTVTWADENVGFYANGIPTTIASGVVFRSGMVYGGAKVGAGQHSVLQSTYLDISGTVGRVIAGSKANGVGALARVVNTTLVFSGKTDSWLHGGGAALYGGESLVEDTASITIMPGAKVEFSVSSGGYAFGQGARSVVKDAYTNISGSVIYAVFLGGYADQRSDSSVTGTTYLNLESRGSVGQSVWCGGRAFNKSNVSVDTVMLNIAGHVGASVHRGGNATQDSTTSTRVIK